MLHSSASIVPSKQKVCGETPKQGNKTIGVQLSPLVSLKYFQCWLGRQTEETVLGVRHLAVRKGLWLHLLQNLSVAVQALA